MPRHDVLFSRKSEIRYHERDIPYASLSSFHPPPEHSGTCIQAAAECRQVIRGPFRASPLNEAVETVEGTLKLGFLLRKVSIRTGYLSGRGTRQQTSRTNNDGINRPPRTTNNVHNNDTRRQTRHRPPHRPLPLPRKNNPNLLVPRRKAPPSTTLAVMAMSDDSGRYEKVAQSFPTINIKAPDQLKFALDESLSFLKAQVLASFEEIIAEREAVARLNELDALIDDARTRKQKGEPPMQKYPPPKPAPATHLLFEANAWSPVLLPPESLIRAHTLPLKRAELAHLESQLSQINGANDDLLREVDAQRTEIEGLNKAMRQGVEDLGGAVGSCSSIPVGEMRDSMEDIIPTLRV
jgi:kinetochore protein NNF1